MKQREFLPMRCGKCKVLLLKGAPIGSQVYCPACSTWSIARPEVPQKTLTK